LPKPPPKPPRKSFARPGPKPGAKPSAGPGERKTGPKPFAKSFSKTGARPFGKPGEKPGDRPAYAKSGDKPFARSGAKPGPKRFGAAKPRPAKAAPPKFAGDKGAAKPAFDVALLAQDISALRTYLEDQAGRKWERVYAELRAHVGDDEAAKEQMLTRLEEVIARQVERVPPSARFPCGLRHAGRGGWSRAMEEGLLYVDPKDGVIKRSRARVYATPAAKD
jgi:hypothetical protein